MVGVIHVLEGMVDEIAAHHHEVGVSLDNLLQSTWHLIDHFSTQATQSRRCAFQMLTQMKIRDVGNDHIGIQAAALIAAIIRRTSSAFWSGWVGTNTARDSTSREAAHIFCV